MKVFKYQLAITDEQVVEMPQGAQILSVQMQHGELCLWALVEPSKPTVKRLFLVHGTGHDVHYPSTAEFIATFQIKDGALVFHVFVIPENRWQ